MNFQICQAINNFAGKNMNGWYYGFKLHLIINQNMDIISFKFSSASTSDITALDRKMARGISGYLIGDKGYLGTNKAAELKKFGISDAYQDHVFDWLDNYPNLYLTKFEKLVGPKGGGTKEEQIEEIMNIARFIEADITEERAEKIGNNLFGGTPTFRRGTFGHWKKQFNEKQKKLFEQDMSKFLIRLGYEDL